MKDKVARPTTKVNGVDGVPTGPKADTQVHDEVKRKPHIFVSERFLPPRPAMVKHLFGFLSKYVRGESSVLADEKGYYIVFEDTIEGRDRLHQCYMARHGGWLFNQYHIRMACRPHGLHSSFATENRDQQGKPTNPVVRSTERPMDEPSREHNKTDQRQSSLPTPPLGPNSETTDSHIEIKTARGSSVNAESPITGTTPFLRHSSPLRVPSRQDKDDSSSSVSGFTGSDLSASRSSKCHICTTTSTSDREILVQCSSCVRRYHRACHPGGIPDGLGEARSWQCRRCIRKKVQPSSRLSNESFASAASPAPSVGQPEEPPAKKRKLEAVGFRATSVDATTANQASTSDESQSQATELSSRPTTNAGVQPVSDLEDEDYSPPPVPAINSDDLRFREADDLVEKSFTSLENATKSAEKPNTPLKLNLTRKKVSRDESTAVISPESRDENNGTPDHSTKENLKQPNLDEGLDHEKTSPKRERHKWKGGGADKYIIQAGTQSSFSNGNNTHATSQDSVPGKGLKQLVFEVPESPEETRTANNYCKLSSENIQSSETQTPPKASLKLHFTKPSDPRGTGSLKLPMGPVQRMKPGGTSADKCRKCNKIIAFNPSGNKYCSKCRHATSAEAAMPSTISTDDRNVENDTVPATAVAAERLVEDIRELIQSANPTSDQVSEPFVPTLAEQNTGSSPAKPSSACQKCRARKKRCTHRSDQDAVEKDREDLDEGDVTRDDLDFWGATDGNRDTNNLADGQISNDKSSTEQLLEVPNQIDRDGSSSLSPPPDEAVPPTTKPKMRNSGLDEAISPSAKIKKRMSFARAATSEYDLGDSKTRPNNTYKKLIGMALCSAPDHCLRGKEITTWIRENIPGYQEESNWANGISATLSMNRDREGHPGPWRKIGGDEAKQNQPCWYQLLPGQEFEMLHWDPVLKQAVSPMKRRHDGEGPQSNEESDDGVLQGDDSFETNSVEGPVSPTRVSKRTLKLSVSRTPGLAIKHARKSVGDEVKSPVRKHKGVETSHDGANGVRSQKLTTNGDVESSDDEPIATKRGKGLAPAHRNEGSAARSTDEDDDIMGLERTDTTSGSPGVNVPKTPAATSIVQSQLPYAIAYKETAAQLIKKEADDVEYFATSLFDEWPEFDPANQVDRKAKIAEIQRRPTRKQRFHNQTADPWAPWKPPRLSRGGVNGPPSQRPDRAARLQTAYDSVEDVVHYDSIQEMFGLPKHPIPILLDKEIAYRDGTRNEYDGTLGRAKEKFKTGYVKP